MKNIYYVIIAIIACIGSVFVAGYVGVFIEMAAAIVAFELFQKSRALSQMSNGRKQVIFLAILAGALLLQYIFIVFIANAVQNSGMGK